MPMKGEKFMFSRLQFHTVPQKLRQFLSMQVYEWQGFPLLIFGIW